MIGDTSLYIYIYICNQIYSILALGICTDLVSQFDANIFKPMWIHQLLKPDGLVENLHSFLTG